MRKLMISGAWVAALLATGALAQPAPTGGPRPPGPDVGAPPPPLPGGPGARPGPGRPDAPAPPGGPGERADMGPTPPPPGRRPPPPPPQGAHFKIQMGDNSVDVKCDEDELMKVCADITTGFLDRMSGTTGRSHRYRDNNDY